MADTLVGGLESMSINQQPSIILEGDEDQDRDVTSQLQNDEQAQLLDLISELRALGVGDHVELPQLIVVGDQSSGKSSVLEAISGFKFPTKDDLCTTFATEINLRPARDVDASVTIEPHSSRSDEQKRHLQEFSRPNTLISELSDIISEAKIWIARTPDSVRPGVFSKDVLKVTVSQPSAPSLTLVDLPGIIQTESGEQTASDVQTVEDLVSGYMRNERSIILAVISANNDVANQIVLRWARNFDQQKKRTLGIITKPDLLNDGSDTQRKFVALAKNQEEPFIFDLGWHTVRNRDFNTRDSSTAERDAAERQFFAREPWSTLPRGHVGVDSLRSRLQKILCKNVQSALPQIHSDVTKLIANHECELSQLGDGRPTSTDKRKYLTSVAERFQALLVEGTMGLCQGSFFNDASGEPQYRLRAAIAVHNLDFAKVMWMMGHATVGKNSDVVKESMDPQIRYKGVLLAPQLLEFQELQQNAQNILDAHKQELWGMFDSDTVGDLFKKQASLWRAIADAHVREVWLLCKEFLEAVVDSSADPACASALKMECIEPAMQGIYNKLHNKIGEIMRPYQNRRPVTNNPRFQEYRYNRKQTAWSSPEEFADPDSPEKELWRNMWAYYDVSIWTFVDNVATLVIQSTLLDKLSGVFSASGVHDMDDDTIELLAAEPADQQTRREVLKLELTSLKEGLKRCHREAMRASKTTVSHTATAHGATPPRAGAALTKQAGPRTTNRNPPMHAGLSASKSSSSPFSQRTPLSNAGSYETPVTSDDEGAEDGTKKPARLSKPLFS